MGDVNGLVLEGGSMRGLFSAGVLDVFMEQGISFDGVVGVSAGAVFGCNYKSGQIGRSIRYNKRFCQDKRYCSIENFLRTGDMFGVDFCYREIPYELDLWDEQAYKDNPMKFYVTCTDVHTGRPVYKRCDNGDASDIQWFRASASMPMVSRVVQVEGRSLLDGGVSDSIPLKFMEHKGYAKNVVVLTQPLGYEKHKNKFIPIARLMLRKYPGIIKALKRRHLMYNSQTKYVGEQEKLGKVLVIRPDKPLGVSGIVRDPDKLESAYQQGRSVALRRLDEIKAYLNN